MVSVTEEKAGGDSVHPIGRTVGIATEGGFRRQVREGLISMHLLE